MQFLALSLPETKEIIWSLEQNKKRNKSLNLIPSKSSLIHDMQKCTLFYCSILCFQAIYSYTYAITEISMQSKRSSTCYHVACDGMRVIHKCIYKALKPPLNCLNFFSALSHSVICLCTTIRVQKRTDTLYVQTNNSVGFFLRVG